jgi:PAS domain S-box-containing protein
MSVASELLPSPRETELPAALASVLAAALQGAADPAFAVDGAGRLLFANRAAAARWPQAAAGSLASELLSGEGRARFESGCAAVLGGAGAQRFEWGEEGPSGVLAWFACTLSPMADPHGGLTGVLYQSSDVTELKRSEARLRRSEQLMVDTQGVAHLGTWEWDVSQPQATWSDELYRIYGLTPETYVPSYENYLKLVHPDDRQRVMDATNRVFHESVPYSHDERVFRPDGSIRYLHTWAYPVRDESGKLARLVGVCQDITDRKLAEEAVRTLNADLERRVAERTRTIERSLRDLETFNAMASHDLRAPLTVIQAACAVMLHPAAEPLPPKVTDNLGRIQQAVSRMSSLVNDLLRLAQLGHGSLTRAEVDLTTVASEVLTQLRRGEPHREADILVEAGLCCSADPGLLRAAVENLLSNAWKYSSRVARARIEVGGAPGQGGTKVFYVRDNGAGFDMKDAHRLFAPFERLHKQTEFEGTGVGLAAVHRIIERHGGRIWAEGELGRGATFYFELPRV